MITEFTNAENWLQRMGRLDRFGENKTANIYISAITENIKNGKLLGNAKFLNHLHCLQSSKAWYDYLQAKLPENGIVNITEMYQIYQAFYKDETSRSAIKQDLISALKESVEKIKDKIIDPISFPKKTKLAKGKVKIKNNSLRGDSRFVEMAKVNIDNGKFKISNDYACLDESFTLSVSEISGYGDSEKDILDFMVKKHHSIIEDKNYGVKATTKYKDKAYLKKAKEPETPIYLSYTPNDLDVEGAKPHAYAIYYAIGKRQPIGAISVHQLVPFKDN